MKCTVTVDLFQILGMAMIARIRVPRQLDSGIVVRPAESESEIAAANMLVFRNYVAEGYWDDDIEKLTNNIWLHSPFRDVFIATHNSDIVATVSIVRDSGAGLPSDRFQPTWLDHFRRCGNRLAEVSALAIEKNRVELKNLSLFLMKYYMQHAFYYTEVDRLVKACRPKHADFYADILRFEKVGEIVPNDYARRPSQLLSIDMIDAHRVLSDYYASDGMGQRNFYHFLLVDKHPSTRFPKRTAYRSRLCDWAAYARLRHAMKHGRQLVAEDTRLSVA